jgi:pyruvate dehydrogenase E1 component beta subunit
MATMSMREAISNTIHDEMARDPNVLIMGEDIVGGHGTPGGTEATGGIWGMTAGLYDKFGANRVIDTPISESCIVGAAAGAAL